MLNAIGFLLTPIVLTAIATNNMLAIVLGVKERHIIDEKIVK